MDESVVVELALSIHDLYLMESSAHLLGKKF